MIFLAIVENEIETLRVQISELQSENMLLVQKVDQLNWDKIKIANELSEVKSMLTKHQNDSICRMQESRRLKIIIRKLRKSKFRYSSIKSDPKMVLFYTGLSKPLFDLALKYGPKLIVCKKLKLEDHLFMTLVKLRRGLSNKDIAYRFEVSSDTASKLLRLWVKKFADFSSRFLLYWPEKKALRRNLPKVFKKKFSKCASIIDCTEIFIERPFDLNIRAKTWSNYKNTNTIKYLVGCAPSGAVNFLSEGWGGCVSDKEITTKSGFLNLIENGDQILADRGFTVGEEIAYHGGILVIPSFTKGRKQLSKKQVDIDRYIARVRIHIERVIGRMRKFNLINTTILLTQVDLLDEIMLCIAGLVNINKRIVF